MPRLIMKLALSTVLAAILLVPATAKAEAPWRAVHLTATAQKQKWVSPRHSAFWSLDEKIYKEGHQLQETLSTDRCKAFALGRGLAVFTPCTKVFRIEYWGQGSFTLLYRIRYNG